jgi:hypothetical protein
MALRGFFQRLLLAAAATAAALLVGEAVLRLLGMGYPPFLQVDAICGSALRPGLEGWFRDEGEAYVRVNRDGFVDRERTLAKPPGTYRIALVGDSYTEAKQLPREKSFAATLEARLAQSPAFRDRAVEVLNFGVAGYSTGQELLCLRHRVLRYSPDLVLLAFYSANDVRTNSRDVEANRFRPFFYLEGDALRLDDSFRESWIYRRHETWHWRVAEAVLVRSRVLQVANRFREHAREWREPPLLRGSEALAAYEGPHLDDMEYEIYREPRDEKWREAWRLTEALLRAMAVESAEHGARFAVVTLTNPIQVFPRPEVRAKFMEIFGISDLLYPDRRIRETGERHGFPVLTLAESLQAYADREHLYLHGFPQFAPGDGHYNATGHEAVGTRIADWLARTVTP